MTVHNPDSGEIFYDDKREARLLYVGRDQEDQFVMQLLDVTGPASPFFTITTEYARHHLVTWSEELIKLERGQVWRRSRNDYSDRAAVVLVTFEFRDTTYVVYDEINAHGPVPKMKPEIDFRRVYGRLADKGDNGS